MRLTIVGLLLVVAPLLGAQELITITVNCGGTCSYETPSSKWDQPACADEEWHTALIESAERGDRSAIALLRKRYELADTYQERHRLGGALLGKIADDRAIWNELAERAAIAVRFPRIDGEHSKDFEAYCRERDVEPDKLWWSSHDALWRLSGDRRARPILFEALKTGDLDLVIQAIVGFAEQKHHSSLAAIETALKGLGEDAATAVLWLNLFRSAEADALAFQYLDAREQANYLELRNAEQ